MSRLPQLQQHDLDGVQRSLWESITGGARAAVHDGSSALVGPDGSLIGPFNAWLHSAGIGRRASDLGAAIRFESSLDRALLELTILVVAAHWRSEFEFWAHRTYASQAGVPDEVIDAIASGDDVPELDDGSKIVVTAARQLLSTGRLDRDRYVELEDALGRRGVVDFVTTVGYYSLVSFNLNAFDVGLPDGGERIWSDD